MNKFKLLPHTGDWRIRASGSSLSEMFVAALYGMFAVAEPRKDEAALTVFREFSVQSSEVSLLLVDFLSAALSYSDIYHEAYDRIEFDELSEIKAVGKFIGKPVAGFETQIKAVTYHDLEVSKKDGQWEALVTLDV